MFWIRAIKEHVVLRLIIIYVIVLDDNEDLWPLSFMTY